VIAAAAKCVAPRRKLRHIGSVPGDGAGQGKEETMQQTAKLQWKALYSAFRAALGGEPTEGSGYVHADVAAVRAAADAVAADRVRAGFALRHATRLATVFYGAKQARSAALYVPRGAKRTLPRYLRGTVPPAGLQAGGYAPYYETRAQVRAQSRHTSALDELPELEAIGAAA
jgi:hypothetical protein